MAISEYAQIIKESGIMPSLGRDNNRKVNGAVGGDNPIIIEHIFIVDCTERCEKISKGAILGLLNLGQHLADTLRIVAYAGSVALILWGGSRFIASLRSKNVKPFDGSENIK
jgi:hypothetical protein